MAGGGLAPTFSFGRGDRAVEAETLVRPVVEGAGLELVDVGFGRDAGRRVLRVVVDRDGGVDLETIAELSERISRRLDLEGFEPGPYSLEVSSPGIERPLKRPKDFGRAVGESVRLRVRGPAGSTIHEGELVSADDEAIVIASSGGEQRVRYDDVASARTIVDWDAELKGSSR
ncbi:MAG TPA: ribosome maturation factor RimP [Actinomycetota bacterium]|jgi:ribosome maturation factor RimP